MSQLPLGIGIGVGLWTTGVGVIALSGGFYDNDILFADSSIGLVSSNDLIVNYREIPCVGRLFNQMTIKKNGTTTVFGGFKQNENISGCLAVWWDKEIYDKYWRGNWNLLWATKNDNNGIIVLSSIKADNGKVIINTTSNFLKKTKNEWSGWPVQQTKQEENINENKTKKTSVILPGDALLEPRDGWDFEFDSKNVCSSKNKCESSSPLQKNSSLNWSFVKGAIPGKQKSLPIYKWSENIDKLVLFSKNSISTYFSKLNGYLKPA